MRVRVRYQGKSTMHTIEQSSWMGEEGVLLSSTSSTSVSSFSDMEVNDDISENILLMKNTVSLNYRVNCISVFEF